MEVNAGRGLFPSARPAAAPGFRVRNRPEKYQHQPRMTLKLAISATAAALAVGIAACGGGAADDEARQSGVEPLGRAGDHADRGRAAAARRDSRAGQPAARRRHRGVRRPPRRPRGHSPSSSTSGRRGAGPAASEFPHFQVGRQGDGRRRRLPRRRLQRLRRRRRDVPRGAPAALPELLGPRPGHQQGVPRLLGRRSRRPASTAPTASSSTSSSAPYESADALAADVKQYAQ